MIPIGPALLGLLLLAGTAFAAEQRVENDEQLRKACARLSAGDVLLLAPGEYRGGLMLADVTGRPGRPIVIAGADREHPPVFVGGSEAIHLTRPQHVVLRDLVVRGQPGNGINIDEGGPGKGAAHHVTVERVRFEQIGPRGNHDALKLSGLTDFEVKGCTFEGWGGSGIDMVGCRRGTIEGCTFRGREDCSQQSGVQAKGGSAAVTIRNCRFEAAGARAVNLGGSTGLAFFRPADAPYEAQGLTVEGCRFRDSETFVAFVGVDGAVVRRNTFVRPRRWVLRILQETTGERFAPCRGGRFEQNLVVFRNSELHRFVNVGPHTAPETFVFRGNAWFALDGERAEDHRPNLPTPETDGRHGEAPGLDPTTLSLPEKSPLRGVGADGFARE
jgi:parallel beta helix pectate lyase-like protein